MKKYFLFPIMLLIFLSGGFAHSGRTDANGGHWNKKTGTYHYHNGGTSSSDSTVTTNQSSQSTITKITINDIENYVYVIKDANLRNGPSSEYDVIRVIKKDSKVKVISIEENWVKIETLETSDGDSWISLSLLKK